MTPDEWNLKQSNYELYLINMGVNEVDLWSACWWCHHTMQCDSKCAQIFMLRINLKKVDLNKTSNEQGKAEN